MDYKKVFLASSEELREDRREFELFVNRRNKDWVGKGVFIETVMWEDFLDAMSPTRLQDEYNKALRGCDLFVMLFWTKVGRYTAEEFETAFGQFQSTRKPFIFTYFKDVPPATVDPGHAKSLADFQAKLAGLGHFYTRYRNAEGLLLHFGQQLDRLVNSGFIEFQPDQNEDDPAGGGILHTGSGGLAVGNGAMAAGERGVVLGGNNSGTIIT